MMGSEQQEQVATTRILLLRAVFEGHIGIAATLLEGGADPNIDTQEGLYLLGLATSRGSLDMVRLLLYHGADVTLRRPTGFTPLHMACVGGHLAILDELLTFGANPSERYEKERTPLHWLAREGSIRILKRLISAGAELHARDSDGYAAIHHAATLGNVSALQELVKAGSSHAWRSYSFQTPLTVACANGQIGTATYLLDDCGADPGVVDGWKHTPLSIAAHHGHLAVVKSLLRYGSLRLGPNAYNDALCGAATRGDARVLKALLNAEGRAHINGIERITMMTPLLCSAVNFHPIVTSMLLKAGGDETIKNPAGQTSLDVVDTFEKKSQGSVRQQRVRRMLSQAPAYRARSWWWPDAPPAFALAVIATPPAATVAKPTKREPGPEPTMGQVEPARMTPEDLDDADNVEMLVTTTDTMRQKTGVRVFRRLTMISSGSWMDGHPMVVAGLIRYARKT